LSNDSCFENGINTLINLLKTSCSINCSDKGWKVKYQHTWQTPRQAEGWNPSVCSVSYF